MAIEITIPRLGWSMDEGAFGEWLKQDGEHVAPGEPIFTLESEKAVQEIESIDGGTLHILRDGPEEGDPVDVGMLVGFLLADGEPLPGDAEIAASRSAAAVSASDQTSHADKSPAVASSLATSSGDTADSAPRRLITPRAFRLARQLGIAPAALIGSGRNGRIRERDVRATAASGGGSLHPDSGQLLSNGKKDASTSLASQEKETSIGSIGRLRHAIADRMLHSVQTTAPVTLTTRVDATHLVSLRGQFKSQNGNAIPAYHDIIAKLAAAALQRHSIMNSQWVDGVITQPDGVHIGIAVDTDAGLLVPVVRNCEQLSLSDLAKQSSKLIRQARERACSPEELSGGTFSITNLGAFGIDAFTPIINPPQTAVLGIGAIRREPVVRDGDRIEPRDLMTLSLTFDHRVTDGAPAARFLQDLASSLQNPGPLLIG